VRSTRHGNPFSFCQTWGQAVFFRSEAGSSYLSQYGENGGGRTRENPRFRKTNPAPKQDEMARFLSDGPSEEEEAQENPQDVDEDVREAMLREVEENKLKLEMWRRLNGGD